MSGEHTKLPWPEPQDFDFRHDPVSILQADGVYENDGMKIAVFHGPDRIHNAALVVTAVNAYASQKAENERLRVAMKKINAIRNSIIGYQNVGWSAHIYPLVGALEDAGFHGEGYEKSRELARTQVDAILALTEENDRLRTALSETSNGKD